MPPSDPANVALYGHRFQPVIKNTTTGSAAYWDRVQTHDNNLDIPTQNYDELGRVGHIGVTQSPPNFRITVTQNLVQNFEQEWVMAGKEPAPPAAQSYNLGNIVSQADNLEAYLLARGEDDTVFGNLKITGCTVERLTFRHTIGGACTLETVLAGRTPVWVPQAQLGASGYSAFGALDDTSYGGIHGKDVGLWMSTGSAAADRLFRIQQAEISVTFPSAAVDELGRRTHVGVMADVPTVNATLDFLVADQQPIDQFFQSVASLYDLAQPVASFPLYIRMFDPLNTALGSALRVMKMENAKVIGGTPLRSAVRSLATSQWRFVSEKNTVANSGGLIVSNRNDL